MPKTLSWLIIAAAATLSLSACKILPTPKEGEAGGAFDPDKMAAEMWAKVIPYLQQKRGRSPR
jgi:predicted lipoprotein